jgi:8-oxo-dGTP diphosphatase
MRIGAGGLLVRGGEVLLARRAMDRSLHPGVWDIIGGHQQGEESPADTLVRELAEEIGVTALGFEEIAVLPEPRPAEYGEARYHVFLVTAWKGGEPRRLGDEHAELRWVRPEQALALPLAHPAYAEILASLPLTGDGSSRANGGVHDGTERIR